MRRPMKPYSFYAYNAMRSHFMLNDQSPERSKAIALSCDACTAALSKESDKMLKILKEIYTSPDNLAQATKDAAIKYGIELVSMWTVIGRVERNFAIARGLI